MSDWPQWLQYAICGQAIGFWILLFQAKRLKKQIRCLHYCYVSISDWGIDRLKEAEDYYRDKDGTEHVPYLLSQAEHDWLGKQKYLSHQMVLAKITVPKDNHIRYPVEDMF